MKTTLKIFGILSFVGGFVGALEVALSTLVGMLDYRYLAFVVARNLLIGTAGAIVFFALAKLAGKHEQP